MEAFFNNMSVPVKFLLAFIVVFAVLGVAGYLMRRFTGGNLSIVSPRGRQPRLAVIDAASVDGRRRLVLVRRDNMEHLLLIGGPTDIVVEPNIGPAAAAAPAPLHDTRASPAPEPPPRQIMPLEGSAWPPSEPAYVEPAPPRAIREFPVREAPIREAQVREAQVREAQDREAPVREAFVRPAPRRRRWRASGWKALSKTPGLRPCCRHRPRSPNRRSRRSRRPSNRCSRFRRRRNRDACRRRRRCRPGRPRARNPISPKWRSGWKPRCGVRSNRWSRCRRHRLRPALPPNRPRSRCRPGLRLRASSPLPRRRRPPPASPRRLRFPRRPPFRN